MTTPTPILTCGTCRHHSPQDVYCTLTGDTRHADDAACMEHSDGTVEDRDFTELEERLTQKA